MTQNMITVALIVGDPGHEGLQLNEGSLAAAARMIEVHGAATHGRWDAGRRSTVWCFDIERARAADLKDELQTIWAGKLESVIWRRGGGVAVQARKPGGRKMLVVSDEALDTAPGSRCPAVSAWPNSSVVDRQAGVPRTGRSGGAATTNPPAGLPH